MLTALPASNAAPARTAGEAALSLALHASFLGAAIWATAAGRGPQMPKVEQTTVHYVEPALPAPQSATPPLPPSVALTPAMISVPIEVPSTLPPIPLAPITDVPFRTVVGPGAPASSPAGPAIPAGDAPAPYDAAFVDKQVELLTHQPVPRYPEMLRVSALEGHVLARFVVDTLGRVEPPSVNVSDATHRLFADAVRDVLLRQRFVPAEAGPRRVRQLVVQAFEFRISR
ncbi:MAG TPA: energy transducer TonB [Gemmatimonadaceae bacterium]|nr:energy transducer TonB [Gemmatimonadaceae bacterium]